MRFDTVIIGGGLSGLVCGIKLQKAGKKCCIVSAGQSALHFSSGAFDILDRLPDGTPVRHPLEGMRHLPSTHPYSRIGQDRMKEYVSATTGFFAECGVPLCGNPLVNSYRLSPTGDFCPAWLSLSDFFLIDEPAVDPGARILIVNIFGYLDFNPAFIAAGLEKSGAICRIIAVKLDEMERLRSNPSEMRATNIAKVLDKDDVRRELVSAVSKELKGESAIIFPAVFGLESDSVISEIRNSFDTKVHFATTMPPSVPGIRTQRKLRKHFESIGGTYLLGDTVDRAELSDDNTVLSVGTVNFGDLKLTADDYVLATGSFFSKGLCAGPEKITEPVFGLDVDYVADRKNWYDTDLFATQNYISFGVSVTDDFQAVKDGRPVRNLHAIGSVLGGYNALQEGSGAGSAIMTAFRVADIIIEKEEKR